MSLFQRSHVAAEAGDDGAASPGSRAGRAVTHTLGGCVTLGETMAIGEELIRSRSTWALFEMRAILRSEGSTREHAQRLWLVDDELRRREAL